MKALVIRSPHIERILAGEKTWEMRTKQTRIRGLIGLIRSGSRTVVGTAELVDVKRDLSPQDMLSNQDKHRIPPDRLDHPVLSKYRCAWVLARAKPLEHAVPYRHKQGAVIWVELEEETTAEVMRQVVV